MSIFIHTCDDCKHRDKAINKEPCDSCTSCATAPYENWEAVDEEKGEDHV